MPATGAVGQMLMTGHYAYGLLFSILSLYAFVVGVRRNSHVCMIVSGFMYAGACWSKELYVPLIGLMLFLPVKGFQQRLMLMWPVILVALLYTVVRLKVLGGAGGYSQPLDQRAFDYFQILRDLKLGFFGVGVLGWACTAVVLLGLLVSLVRVSLTRHWGFGLLFSGAVLVVVFLPIAPMLLGGMDSVTLVRLFYFAGWVLAVLLALSVGSSFWSMVYLAVVIVMFGCVQRDVSRRVERGAEVMEAQTAYMLSGPEGERLLPRGFDKLHYLESVRLARRLLTDEIAPAIVRSRDEYVKLSDADGVKSVRYDAGCLCMKPVGIDQFRLDQKDYLTKLELGARYSLDVQLSVEDFGAQKVLRWNFSGEDGQFVLNLLEFGKMNLPPSGEYVYGLDVTGPLNTELHAYVEQRLNNGGIVRSPILILSPSQTNRVSWRGESAVDW